MVGQGTLPVPLLCVLSPRNMRVCVVTGASRGIGRGIALVLARNADCVVYATARSIDALQALRSEVAESGGGGELVPCSVDHTDDEAMGAFVERVVKVGAGVDEVVEQWFRNTCRGRLFDFGLFGSCTRGGG